MTPFRKAELNLPPVKEFIKQTMEHYGCSREEAKVQYNRLKQDKVWVNDLYQVNIDYNEDGMLGENIIHLSIKRRDKQPIHDWRHLQQIKNELIHPEREALELYPAESRVLDTANQYHLWVLDPGGKIPCGYRIGGKTENPEPGAVQRPFDKPINGG